LVSNTTLFPSGVFPLLCLCFRITDELCFLSIDPQRCDGCLRTRWTIHHRARAPRVDEKERFNSQRIQFRCCHSSVRERGTMAGGSGHFALNDRKQSGANSALLLRRHHCVRGRAACGQGSRGARFYGCARHPPFESVLPLRYQGVQALWEERRNGKPSARRTNSCRHLETKSERARWIRWEISTNGPSHAAVAPDP
jgi:hypothetical protein